MHPSYARQVSSCRVLHLKLLRAYNICIIYLHLIEVCLKVTIAMFYFCHSEHPSDIMKNIFNSISIYSFKKISFLTNVRNKEVVRKTNFYFFTSWKMALFFLQKFVIFNMIPDSFLVEKWGTLERERRYLCKYLLNLDFQDSICFAFFKLLKNEESFGEFFFPIFCKLFGWKLQLFLILSFAIS